MMIRILYHADGTKTYLIDGKVVTKEEVDAHIPPASEGIPGGHHPACWPMVSDAAGVHPLDTDKASEDAKSKGVPTDFNGEGQAIFRDRGHRKAFLKAYGMRDNQGGYGD